MKHFKTLMLLPAIGLALLIAQSCDKEKDNQTTTNKGDIVFWQTNSTMLKYKGQGVNYYTIYLNGLSHGEAIEEYYWTSAPPCGATHALTVNKDIGTNSESAFALTIRDNNSNILIESTVTVKKDGCTAFEIK